MDVSRAQNVSEQPYSKQSSRSPGWLAHVAYVLIALWFFWLIGVLASGMGFNLFGRDFNFETSAKFGDAFGSLNGLMASLAAAGAWYAVALQRRGLEEQDAARNADDAIRRQQAFEQNFFQLLGHLAAIVRETDIVSQRFALKDTKATIYTGKDAFRRILHVLRNRFDRWSKEKESPPETVYMNFYSEYQDGLGHYFRVLYHICNYINVNKDVDRQFYMKIVFGQLSNSELLLVGYNCAFGHGQRRFKPIVEEFGGLTNVGFDEEYDLEQELLRSRLAPAALPSVN